MELRGEKADMKQFITINDKEYSFKEGETILNVALRNNIDIPVLCYLRDIAETGACRICLVEVEGVPKPVASCSAFATDGMVVRTDTDEVKKHRLKALEFILLKHPLKCSICENAEDCILRELAHKMGISEIKDIQEEEKAPLQDWNILQYDRDLCVLCMRCINVCRDVAGCSAIDIVARGNNAHIEPVEKELNCDFCGICVDVCPVGAIKDKPFNSSMRVWEPDYITTSCAFCPVGCEINYGVKDNTIHRTRKSSKGYICSKGRYSFKFLENDQRVKFPLLKVNNNFVKVDWHTAMENIYDGLTKNGISNSLLVCGAWLSNEELFAYKSLAEKTGMMFLTEAEIYFGDFARKYYEKFGQYESRGTLKDVEQSDVIFIVGADFSREDVGVKWSVMKAVRENNAKLITIGLQRYDYDEKTFLSLIADYGNFAYEFENIKTSDKNVYSALRKQISQNSKISIITGNEYFSSERDLESVLAFADYIGEEKLNSFIITYDKVNFAGSLYIGSDKLSDIENAKPKAVFVAAVNAGRGKNERLLKIIKEAEFVCTPEIFVTGIAEQANVVLPVKSVLETEGTALSLDGQLLHFKKIVNAPSLLRSNLEIVSVLGDFFRKKIDNNSESIFKTHAEEMGFKKDDWERDEEVYKENSKLFNKTEYVYSDHSTEERDIYVNSRHHEGVLTKMAYSFNSDNIYPEKEELIEPGCCRSANMEDNIAKGIRLIPR